MADEWPTPRLRWVIRGRPFDMINRMRVLQQQWVVREIVHVGHGEAWNTRDENGFLCMATERTEWRDVPVEDEDD